jgi:flavin reductase (DIM6/NTAB) family NADH-FMN oxidoreductase RutF
VEECLANIECEVVDTSMVDHYDLFVLEALAIWRDPDRHERRALHHQGDGTFAADGEQLDLRERMVLWKQFQD